MLRKIGCGLLFVGALASAALGQNGQGQNFQRRSTITVTVDKLNCTTSLGTQGAFAALSWTFGDSQVVSAGTGTGVGGGGKPSFTDVSFSKRTDSCSPLLFGAVAQGQHIAKVTILQQDNNKDDVFQVTLEDVVIANYQLSGEVSREVPTEQISFNFRKITLMDSITGTKFSWDLSLGRTF